MSTDQLVLHRLKELPEELKLRVPDYLDSLIVNFNGAVELVDQEELSEEHKRILDERFEKHAIDLYSGEDWEVVKKRQEIRENQRCLHPLHQRSNSYLKDIGLGFLIKHSEF